MSRTELLQRAIHSAKCRIYRINYDLNCTISLNHQRKAKNQKELMEITVEALEKQIPKKPIFRKENKKVFADCPNCNKTLTYEDKIKANFCKFSYCFRCGQAIDWSGAE
jgi:hypothetical protein